MFGAKLNDFCDNNLCFIDKEKLSLDSFTFVPKFSSKPVSHYLHNSSIVLLIV